MDGPRTKDSAQVVRELEALRVAGWKDMVFVVDDNFIGNRKRTREMLGALIEWRGYGASRMGFLTEASVNLADHEELCELMVEAGFKKVFLGIETPSDSGLLECGKTQKQQTRSGGSRANTANAQALCAASLLPTHPHVPANPGDTRPDNAPVLFGLTSVLEVALVTGSVAQRQACILGLVLVDAALASAEIPGCHGAFHNRPSLSPNRRRALTRTRPVFGSLPPQKYPSLAMAVHGCRRTMNHTRQPRGWTNHSVIE